jgi:RNA polymerase sigma-70 factor, ECF subfamily
LAEFAEVYAACHRSVYALCRSLLGNADDAQDAAQEAFLAIARHLDGFRGESSVKTWAHRIAVHAALKVRARRRSHDEISDDVPAQMSTPDLAVRRAARQLSLDHQIVLAMFAVEGMTHPEIAATLGIPEGTVWSRLHAAKKKLAALLTGAPGAAAAVRDQAIE